MFNYAEHVQSRQHSGTRQREEYFLGPGDLPALQRNVETDWIQVLINEATWEDIQRGYLDCFGIKLSRYDLIVSTKSPAYAVQHPNHVCWLLHQMRVFYDRSTMSMESYPNTRWQRSGIDATPFVNSKIWRCNGSGRFSPTATGPRAGWNGKSILRQRLQVLELGYDPPHHRAENHRGNHGFPRILPLECPFSVDGSCGRKRSSRTHFTPYSVAISSRLIAASPERFFSWVDSSVSNDSNQQVGAPCCATAQRSVRSTRRFRIASAEDTYLK